MAKIELKANLVLGTNYKYHLVDFQGTDIVISNTNDQITSSSTDFTASSETAGIVKRPVAVGDILTIKNTANSANEGITVQVDTVTANQIDYTLLTGSPVDEGAGANINIIAFTKTFEFLEASGLWDRDWETVST